MTESIAHRMLSTGGKSSGFDYIRLILSTLVIFSHSFTVILQSTEREEFIQSVYYRPFVVILPMFFALSGFLVSGSFARKSSYKEFYGLRVLRIVPALAVETTISALVLGVFFTSLNLREYFQSAEFWRYFYNIVGHIQFTLPGVFENNPIKYIVNSQLWTVPYELYCYLAIGLIGISGLLGNRRIFLTAFAVFHVVVLLSIIFYRKYAPHLDLVLSFVAGMIIYSFREKLPWNGRLAIALALICAALINAKGGIYLCVVPLAYLVVYIGLLNPSKNKFLLSGDYSYGLYLYGFAIQQAVASGPAWMQSWYANFAVSLAIASLCAVVSWWVIEKPALQLRRFLRPRPVIIATNS